MKVFLETERLMFREFVEEDVDNLWELDSDREVMRFINGGQPSNRETIQNTLLPRFLGFYEKYDRYGIWAAIEKLSGDFIGWFHFFPATEHKFVVELNLVSANEIALGYRLCRSSWGKGYATEGSRALIAKGFAEWGVQRAIAWALAANQGSIRVMQKVGLKFDKEFSFQENQLPMFNSSERKAVMYALNRKEF